jgi:hypothetical protein
MEVADGGGPISVPWSCNVKMKCDVQWSEISSLSGGMQKAISLPNRLTRSYKTITVIKSRRRNP